MDLGLKDKVALVGGASKGLGREVARSLAREGAKVAICARNKELLEQTALAISRETGAQVFWRATDLSNPVEVKAFVQEAVKRFETVHILVNNAGGPPSARFLELDDQNWEEAFHLNLMSAIRLTRHVLPYMRKQGWGRIINLTSAAVKQPMEGLILSNSIRAAVHGWAKSLSNELAREGVLVNCVCTGFMHTERVEQLAESLALSKKTDSWEIIRGWEAQIPMGRLGKPEELADLVTFLASDRAGYITGTSIAIDGGYCKGLL
ncbi:MAG: SDR family oxidoreductase [bacterium]